MDTAKGVHRNLIGGEWCDAADVTQNVSPSDTREIVGLYARGGAADAQRAVEAARAAFPAWAGSSPQLRHDILARAAHELQSRREELGRLLSSEEGKTLPEGIGEVARAASVLSFMAGEALRIRGDRLPGLQPVDRRGEPRLGIARHRRLVVAQQRAAQRQVFAERDADLLPRPSRRAGRPQGRHEPFEQREGESPEERQLGRVLRRRRPVRKRSTVACGCCGTWPSIPWESRSLRSAATWG